MNRKEMAAAYHQKGYNCAQAVACAFADKVEYSEQQIFAMTEAFGLGGGNMAGTCGAVAGGNLILSCLLSGGDPEHPVTKAATYKVSGGFQAGFAEQNGSVICRELKGVDTGKVLTPCPKCIENAVGLLEEILS